MTHKILQVFHTAFTHYTHYYLKHFDKGRFTVDLFNVDERPEASLPEIAAGYDYIHFWVEVSPDIMSSIRKLAPKTFVSITNPFGDPIPSLSSEPWDVQVHVTKSAFAKYCRRVQRTPHQIFPRNVVNYLPVDTDIFEPRSFGESERAKIRSSLGIEDDELVLCRTGRADIWKWDHFAVHLLDALRKRGLKSRFIVVGGLPQFARSELKRRSLDSRVLVVPFERYGASTDVRTAKILAAADLYVHSAFIGESCGMSILEAMSMGKPVLVTRKDWADNAPTEYITNGSNGFLVSSVEECARLIVSLGRDENRRQRIGINARKTVVDLFDARKGVANFETMYTTKKETWGESIKPTFDQIEKWYQTIQDANEASSRLRGANRGLFLLGVRLRRSNNMSLVSAVSGMVKSVPRPAVLNDLEIVL